MFMVGGEFPDGSASRSAWRYDASLDCWQEMAPMCVSRSELGEGHCSSPRLEDILGLSLLDGFIYAVGGWDGSVRLASVERYNIATNGWASIATMKMAVTSPAVVAHEGVLYVMGGAVLEDGDGIDLVQCYSPMRDEWTQLRSMEIARSGAAACVLNGFIYIIGVPVWF